MANRGPAENQLNNFKKTVKVCRVLSLFLFSFFICYWFDMKKYCYQKEQTKFINKLMKCCLFDYVPVCACFFGLSFPLVIVNWLLFLAFYYLWCLKLEYFISWACILHCWIINRTMSITTRINKSMWNMWEVAIHTITSNCSISVLFSEYNLIVRTNVSSKSSSIFLSLPIKLSNILIFHLTSGTWFVVTIPIYSRK